MQCLSPVSVASRAGILCALLVGALFVIPPARAADTECDVIAGTLAASGAAAQRIETARRKLSELPACGYLVADAARIGLPPGADRARIVDEALEQSRDWAPTIGPQRIGYLKAAILAGTDPSLDLPKWRARVSPLLIEYGNLTSRREVAELEASAVRGYDTQRQNPFAIPDCERLPAISEQLTADLSAACAARRAFTSACEPVVAAGAQPTAPATRRCADGLKALLDRYPRAEANATVAVARRRVADLAQADAVRAESERQAAAERARAEQQRRLEAERAERARQAQSEQERRRRDDAAERTRIAGLDAFAAARETLALFDSRARPSFDCNVYARKELAQRTPIADLLCISPDLAEADRQLGDAYRAFRDIRAGSARDAVLFSQRQWVQMRDATCQVSFNAILDTERRQAALDCVLMLTVARAAEFR